MCQFPQGLDNTLTSCHTVIVPRAIPSHFLFIMAFKQFKCTVIFSNGNPAIEPIIEANNPPQARDFAEARYPGGRCTAANQLNG